VELLEACSYKIPYRAHQSEWKLRKTIIFSFISHPPIVKARSKDLLVDLFYFPHLAQNSSKQLLKLCQMGSPTHSQLALPRVLCNHHYIILFGNHFLFYTIFRWCSFIACVSVDDDKKCRCFIVSQSHNAI
jgi:hypothetical protein